MNAQTEWVQVDALAEGFAKEANILEHVNDLTGKTFILHAEDMAISHHFESEKVLTWEVLDGVEKGAKGQGIYKATCLREGIYFVDFVKEEEFAASASIVLNLAEEKATIVVGQMPSESEAMRPIYQRVKSGELLTSVQVDILQCSIGKPFGEMSGHEETEELVGKRVQYEYSPHEYYEHIYLNSNYYTWHCMKGVERGLVETDKCHHFKVADDLFLFVWREKVIPTLGIIMIDLSRFKTTGKILGFDGTEFKKINNFPVGAKASILNETEHHIE
ncbi:Protein moaF [Vibrio coralliirubri]|uniref:molybdenum cofactor biosynthesis F family protein n=1 Tax=Vibrio coralliirubri TaxID=1516159 RepID=UPI00062F3B69|nr:molybdenum cofactor biosynthesis F family protein [Vibrio coralliirubri]CDT53919.1 Protein moaF [Vibrio coralliirubri]